MNTYSLTHLADGTLLSNLNSLVARDRATAAELLAHIAEVDARRLYLRAAYPSMHFYCVSGLRLSEDAAFKRIHAARVARDFPVIFPALADGRLHLSGVILLAPHLSPETADELLAAAADRSKSEIELLLARRFPRPDVPTRVESLSPPASLLTEEPGPESVDAPTPGVDQHAPGRVEVPAPRAQVAPLAPERFALQVTIGQETHDKLRYAQSLLSHQVPAGDVAQVLDRALDALIGKLQKQKFAATTRPRQSHRRSTNPRYVPSDVRRAVWARDGGQCTFVSATGQRCAARDRLEFDHVDEVARGGQATVSGIRLLCRSHNQHAAERTFGAGFMAEKRSKARRVAAEKRERAAAERERVAAARSQASEAEQDPERSVIPWLRRLGFRTDEARRAAALSEAIPDAPLEERVRVALSSFHPRTGQAAGARVPAV